MAGEIKVDCAVMQQVIGEIKALAEQADCYGVRSRGPSRSKGATAARLIRASEAVARFAGVLAAVMRDTARRLSDAEAEMRGQDGALAGRIAGAPAPRSVRLSDCLRDR